MPYDERDVIFARMNYEKGEPAYEDYYERNPEKERMDKITRMRPLMGDSRSSQYNPIVAGIPDACFAFLGDMKQFVQGDVAEKQQVGTPEQFTEILNGLATYYGAVKVGITELKEEQYYSHKGRPIERYGEEIETKYKYAIVFAVEMDQKLIDTAPLVTESIATSKGYMDAAVIGMVLSYYIRGLGYEARNNMDGNYILPLPPVAEAAGLGEMGLNGLLITPEYGPRVRLGVVTTNIPLVPQKAKPLFIKEYCQICRRCEKACVSRAINNPSQGNEHGFYDNVCLGMWQRFGSDCGVCITACPFAHSLPEWLLQNLDTKEGRIALDEYWTKLHPRREVNRYKPDWVAAAYRKIEKGPSTEEIFKLLPEKNCGVCNCGNCMAFAEALSSKKADPLSCIHLGRDQMRALIDLVGEVDL